MAEGWYVCIRHYNHQQSFTDPPLTWLTSYRAKQIHGDRYTVYSAGSVPAAAVNPGAVEVMLEVGIDMSNHIPKTLTSLQSQGFQPDYVVTVCNDACPSVPRGIKVRRITIK